MDSSEEKSGDQMGEQGAAAMGWSEEEMLEGQVRAFGLAFGHVASLATKAVCELGIPDMLASSQRGLTSLELAHEIGHDAPRHTQELDRLMRVLCAHGIFAIAAESSPSSTTESAAPRYKLTAVSRWLFLKPDSDQDSVFPLLRLVASMPFLAAWDHLPARILRGVSPFQQAHDNMDLWSFTRTHPGFCRTFKDAMTCNTRVSVKALLNCYGGFATTHTLVDVGGGEGTAVGFIVQQLPHIQGINLELPHVVAAAPAIQGVQHISGDMFKFIPPCDTILLKCVLHDWDDEDCIKILQNCYKALSTQGKLIIMDPLLEHDISTTTNNTINMTRMGLDIHLMVATLGGQERTASQFQAILQASGFKISNTIDIPCLECIIEALPVVEAS